VRIFLLQMEILISFVFYNFIPLCLYYYYLYILVFMSMLCFLVVRIAEPVYSVLLLVVIFLLTAFSLLLLNVEFLAYVYVIVYVGAVVILFVFVVFTLGPVYTKAYRPESFGLFYVFGFKFLFLFAAAVWDFLYFPGWYLYQYQPFPGFLSNSIYKNDITIFSKLLYTEHFFLLWVVAVILLVAMVGPIIFHFNHKLLVRGQH
jgi:NADH-quinone oxidoreductase subunit J